MDKRTHTLAHTIILCDVHVCTSLCVYVCLCEAIRTRARGAYNVNHNIQSSDRRLGNTHENRSLPPSPPSPSLPSLMLLLLLLLLLQTDKTAAASLPEGPHLTGTTASDVDKYAIHSYRLRVCVCSVQSMVPDFSPFPTCVYMYIYITLCMCVLLCLCVCRHGFSLIYLFNLFFCRRTAGSRRTRHNNENNTIMILLLLYLHTTVTYIYSRSRSLRKRVINTMMYLFCVCLR